VHCNCLRCWSCRRLCDSCYGTSSSNLRDEFTGLAKAGEKWFVAFGSATCKCLESNCRSENRQTQDRLRRPQLLAVNVRPAVPRSPVVLRRVQL
jgi:hypothetical protein